MNVGTKTLLFGAHQFVLHPVTVWLAWVVLFRSFPRFYQLCAIVTHDWGYWGCPNVDGEEGSRHPMVAAEWWIGRFGKFGNSVAHEILGHSRFYAQQADRRLTNLFYADKLSPTLYPRWLYLLLVCASGEVKEYVEHTSSGKYRHEVKHHSNLWVWMHQVFAHMSRMGIDQQDECEGLTGAQQRKIFLSTTEKQPRGTEQ